MAQFRKGIFTPTNPSKYVGKTPIVYRSSLELTFFRFLDSHSSVIEWSSESLIIPYYNPLKKRMCRYYPDVVATFKQNDGTIKTEIIEIKPYKQTIEPK